MTVTMAPGIVPSILSADNLYRAWEAVRDRAHALGAPSPSVLAFGHDPAAELQRLAADVGDGSYRPAPLQRIEIPKPAGGTRRLAIPPVRDRVLERAVHQVLEPVLDPTFTPWSFGYRPGLGIEDAIEAVREAQEMGAESVLRTDVADCFDTLGRDKLLTMLAARVPDDGVLSLVRMLLCRPVRIGFNIEPRLRGVPQGAPLSPLLCNLYLNSFDEAMLDRGWRPIRYADDIVVAAASPSAGLQAATDATAATAVLGLRLSPTKTRTATFAEGFEYLGTSFTAAHRNIVPRLDPPRSKALYVTCPGAHVGISGGQLRVRRANTTLLAVPVEHVGQVVVYGRVEISSELRLRALERGLDVVFLSRNGRYQGRLCSPRVAHTDLRRRQYLLAEDPEARAALARAIVSGKLANLRALLLRRLRLGRGRDMAHAATRIDERRTSIAETTSVPTLLGIEGAASRVYFGAFGGLFPAELGFDGRHRRPPRDPVNSALSFCYSLLTSEAVGAVAAAGFDPHVGFLHSIDRARASLALDLMEEFRAPVVDTIVVEAFGRGSLRAADFSVDAQRGCLLTDEGRRRLLDAYERRLLTVFAHVPTGQRVTYRRALFLQARQLAAVVLGVRPGYRPVLWR